MVRIFTACHGTQLLLIQHLRHNLQQDTVKDFLLWHPMENVPFIDNFMRSVISTADFADTLDIRNFASLQPRTQGALSWWVESVRRLQRDATAVRLWMARNGIAEAEVELWTDDPVHFYVNFLRGLLQKAHHVKIPHCFNHEDVTIPAFKQSLESKWRATPWPKKFIFLPWQRSISGVDVRMERIVYDRAYTFDRPSSWAETSLDISHLISIEAFDKTYRTLPAATRAEVEKILSPIRTAQRPLVLLLLFGLDHELRRTYEVSVSRTLRERASELKDCSFAVKVHPGARGTEEQIFIDWLKGNISGRVFPIVHALNLEFMLPQLRPDYVLAGPCGALPIVNRLKVARPIALSEITEAYIQQYPSARQAVRQFLDGIEIW
jgi:hypothetical protein